MNKLIFILILSFPLVGINAQYKGNTILGRVIDLKTNEPITDAIIYIYNKPNEVEAMALTDSLGFYNFLNVEFDKIYIKAKKMGYEEFFAGKIPFRTDTLQLTIKLDAKAFILGESVVVGQSQEAVLSAIGFYERKEKSNGFFLEDKNFNKNAHRMENILREIKGLSFDKYGAFNTRGRNIAVYLDGQLVTTTANQQGTLQGRFQHEELTPNGQRERLLMELESKIFKDLPASNVTAIEYYNSSTNAPSQYVPAIFQGGILLIWTK